MQSVGDILSEYGALLASVNNLLKQKIVILVVEGSIENLVTYVRIELLFTHKNDDFAIISVTEQICIVPNL